MLMTASSALAHSLNSQERTVPCLTQTAHEIGLAGTGKAVFSLCESPAVLRACHTSPV